MSDYIYTNGANGAAEEDKPVTAKLKWFNATKGFGFLVLEESQADAFLHITVMQNAGVQALGEDALLKCQVKNGPKGYLVTKVLEVIDHGNLDMIPEDSEENLKMTGIVKWYKPDKGFGFIVPEDGRKDVFVHKTCLDRAGISGLEPGQRVSMSVQEVDKGREALKITLSEGAVARV